VEAIDCTASVFRAILKSPNDNAGQGGERSEMGADGTVKRLAKIEARPEQAEIDLSRTALIIVDMQNVFAGRGDRSDIVGPTITRELIEKTKSLIETARKAAIKVVYLKMMKDPERKSKSLIRTVGDTKIVDELSPLPGDIVIEKTWYSGFRETSLDRILRESRIEYLIFTGVVTNVCVESTLRDSYFLNYWPILVSDATNHAGPFFTQQATEWNVESSFGWVTTTENVLTALSGG
jgi:ureidoacrylate peracid hydrolase